MKCLRLGRLIMRFLLSSQCCTLKRHCQPGSEGKIIAEHTQDVFVFIEVFFHQPLPVSRKGNRFRKQHSWPTSFLLSLCMLFVHSVMLSYRSGAVCGPRLEMELPPSLQDAAAPWDAALSRMHQRPPAHTDSACTQSSAECRQLQLLSSALWEEPPFAATPDLASPELHLEYLGE